jgi:DNA (cytosine-5)-methyltransferase 1
MEKNKIKVGSDFSGVGAFNQALKRLGVNYEEIFACDMDKYARQTFIHNYGEPKYYPTNVYDREIPTDSLDIYMTSPPCQAFSLAGKRLGKEDKRGILFFNSYEFIQVNKPRYFIFENVKGLLSDDEGKTFQEWVNMLGGKSVNGVPIIFPYEESVPYHLYWKVLNAKDYGVPQNRERVFLIGIRDDEDNNFRFPLEETLTKKLKDVLEPNVDDKYFLSEAAINKCLKSQANENMLNEDVPEKSRCIVAGYYKQPFDGQYLKIKSATSKGHEEATEGDSVNLSAPNSKTRRGRVGKGVAQTLDTGCQQAVILGYTRDSKGKVVSRNIWEQAGTIHTSSGSGGNTDQFVLQYNDKRLNETIAKNKLQDGEIKILDTYNKTIHDECPTLKKHHAENGDRKLWDGYKIRRLTPRECFRLMDFPDTFTWPVSDSQAYKQAGNSIVVNVLYKILKSLNL